MIYFIVNGLSGKGKGARTASQIETILKEHDFKYKMVFTKHCKHAIELAAQLSREPDCSGIVAVGGDGTFSEVLNGLDLNIPMGVIPSGSGNDFMRVFEKKESLEEMLEPIISGRIKNIDYISVNDKRCLNVAGTGFDVDILNRATKFRKYIDGPAGYFAALITTLFTMKFRNITLTIDDKIKIDTPFLLMAAANGRYIGGGLPISVRSNVDDGIMDLVFIKKMPRILVPWMLVKFLKGKITDVKKYVESYQCRKIGCSVRPKMDIQIDGEILFMPDFICELKPGKLKIFA